MAAQIGVWGMEELGQKGEYFNRAPKLSTERLTKGKWLHVQWSSFFIVCQSLLEGFFKQTASLF